MRVVRKEVLAIVAIALLAALAGYYALQVYAQEQASSQVCSGTAKAFENREKHMLHKSFAKKLARHALAARFIEVSPEYASEVEKILRENPETATLLEEGFTIAKIKPLVRAYVGAGGEVTLKATQAIVVLKKGSEACYAYLVDLSNGTVTKLPQLNKLAK
ncbi:MAG: hypothetical protein QXS85_02995 [Acidilobaceae archaeon]